MMLVNNIVHDDGCFVFMCGLDYCFEQHCLKHKFKSYVRDWMIINEMFNNYEAQKDNSNHRFGVMWRRAQDSSCHI
jgi:hypothetical protein